MSNFTSQQKPPRRKRGIWLAAICIGIIGIGYMLRSAPTVIRLSMVRHGDKSSVPFAIRQLKSPNSNIRTSACRALGQIGPAAKPATAELLALLKDKSPGIVSDAAWGLGNIYMRSPEPNVIEGLVESLNHTDGEVRRYSAYALSLIGDKSAIVIEALTAKLDDPHMAYMAASAMGEIGPKARSAIPKIAALLKSDNNGARAESAIALSKLQPLPDEVVEQVKGLLFDPDPLVRDCAKKASDAIVVERMKKTSGE